MREPKYPAPFVTNEQAAIGRDALRRGYSLRQAARFADCLAADLDQRLWQMLGERRRPTPMFRDARDLSRL